MMQASPYPAQPGMGPGHPGMAHNHPMAVQHGGHMGQPNPGMMGGMHPGMSGPQVTQGGPMASGMPPNPGTPAPGNPMQNTMAMAHLGGQNPMFHGQNPQMNLGQMQQQVNANMIARQRALNNMMQAQNGQIPHGMMNMQNLGHLNPAQIQQMKAMSMPMQQMQHMTPQQQQLIHQQQQYQHQQRMMAQHAAAQQQIAAQQRQHVQQQQQHQQQQHASQQMQMSRSQDQTTQPPPQQPTPAPQAQPPPSQPQPQPQPQANAQPQQQQPQQQPQPQQQQQQQPQQQTPKPQSQPQPAQPPTSQPQQQNAPTPQVKQGEPDEETQIKPDLTKQQILMDDISRAQNQDFNGQCILQLLSYYDSLAYPARPNDIDGWQEFISKYYSPLGSIRQSIYNYKTQVEKSFQINFPSLARFYHSHFNHGVRKITMQSFEHTQEPLPNGGFAVGSKKLYLTYEYNDGLRVTAHGHLNVNFDDMQKIEHFSVAIKGWTEYLPRTVVREIANTFEQNRQSPKMTKKNLPKNQQQRMPTLPPSPIGEWGMPPHLVQFLEVAEVINVMGSLIQYSHQNPGIGPREALNRFNAENSQAHRAMAAAQMHNNNAMAMNGQGPFPNQRMAGMNPPNQFQSPAFSHLGLPQNQGSPRINHTPSPAHNAAGGVQMVHQMSAQGSSTLSGSQGPSTNTSPNVPNKRRRASQIKEEENQVVGGDSKTKPSPQARKRQKGGPA